MSKIIHLTVSPTGENKVWTEGYKGESCKAATEQLEKALGTVTSETLTEDFYAREKNTPENRTSY